MDHSEARRLLEDSLAGTLGGERGAGLREHLAGCAECREFGADLRLFARALGNPTAGHPAAEEIALRAADPDCLAPIERARLDRHLDTCPECRRELTLTTEALARARGGRGRLAAVAARVADTPRAARWAIAAGLIAAVALGFLYNGTLATDVAVGDRSLSGESLRGDYVVDATGSITATSMTIDRGSNVAFRAGESVALGDGFSVGPDASFSIEITDTTGAPREANGS